MARVRQANQRLNFKPNIEAPGMWQFPANPDRCCIYRVPYRLRHINPKAYTPQLLIIGPLHHSRKAQALERRYENIDNTRSMGYVSMQQHKEIYILALAERFGGKIIDRFKSVIEEEEEAIRASYSESTTWIKSQEFVEMILKDSVFILEFMLRYLMDTPNKEKTGDILMDEPCLFITIQEDLMLLENQLPYFILEKIFDPILETFYRNLTFRKLAISYFGLKDKMNDNSKFEHFTDLLRCVRVDSLKLEEVSGLTEFSNIKHLYNAEKLHSGGLKFKVIEDELSLNVKFEKGCLKIPVFMVDDRLEMKLRNIMALEQCHYPYNAYVCSFMDFLDYLIDTDKDVDFLAHKGIISNCMGDHGLVADMVNKLSLGIIDCGSYYCDTALKIEAHYKNRYNKSCALLKHVYFKDMWIGTATTAATVLLILTLTQTITSIMQVLPK